ncbi:MAG: hypothetical protein V5A68_01130 [Candidatus Thermoplasmatota archaeon]
MRRLSVSLDDKSTSIINKYVERYDLSRANVVRKALRCFDREEKLKEKSKPEDLSIYADFLSNMEHIILDIVHWKAIFQEIDEGSDGFWKKVKKTGREHRREYYDKGIRDIQDVLEYVEKTNWYRLSKDSEKSYTLILNVSGSGKFISKFFEGFFEEHPEKVNIFTESKKVRINVE